MSQAPEVSQTSLPSPHPEGSFRTWAAGRIRVERQYKPQSARISFLKILNIFKSKALHKEFAEEWFTTPWHRTGQCHNFVWSIFCQPGFGQPLNPVTLFSVISFCSFLHLVICVSSSEIKAIMSCLGSKSARLWVWAQEPHEEFLGEKNIPAAWHFPKERIVELKAEGAFATTIN